MTLEYQKYQILINKGHHKLVIVTLYGFKYLRIQDNTSYKYSDKFISVVLRMEICPNFLGLNFVRKFSAERKVL
jgi:hypothetical protein